MFIEYLKTYGIVIVEFLAELYIFYGLVMRKLKKKDHFVLKAILGLVCVLLLAFPIAILYYYIGENGAGRILVYSLLFLISLIHCCLCFNESIWTVVLGCVFSYTLQNLVYKVFLTIWVILLWFNLTSDWDELFNLWYRLIYYTNYFGLVVVAEFLFIRKISYGLSGKKLNLQLLGISFGVLIITIILCSMEDVYFLPLTNGTENSYNDFDVMMLR
ncbi:MAG: hypothetical protein HUJ61_07425, partial [Bacilli bacterium]|nr:hypothetical protein [Bacilli bacterium]